MITEHQEVNKTTSPTIKQIERFIHGLRSYKPKVAIVGKSGAGKSSLLNALFGEEVSKVSDIETGTTEVQRIELEGITLLDFPGLADANKFQETQFLKQYQEELSDVDLALWVIKAKDRANEPDIRFYEMLLKPEMDRMPTMFVISQCDELAGCPLEDWDHSSGSFGPKGAKTPSLIQQKIIQVSKDFDVSVSHIHAVSVKKSAETYKLYEIEQLIDKIVKVLPDQKKYALTREVDDSHVSTSSRIEAEKGLWTSVKEFAGDAFDGAIDMVSDLLIASIPSAISSIVKKFKFW